MVAAYEALIATSAVSNLVREGKTRQLRNAMQMGLNAGHCTLEMSLTGIRDLSLVNTAPEDRQPILTYVGGYDERAVGEAIRRELLREGQVFFGCATTGRSDGGDVEVG